MRIKKLTIFGFKSFADRVMIHFDEGVTGIVGPNGCGKSNVVDALRWVMGEQNAKQLRGNQMKDIIFNGSQNRGPMGLAEVILTMENDGQSIPTEYTHFDEIEITRRLYRNGNSEYEINKRACRLRDIADFFMGTGVGSKAYSIIEQGRVSNLVQSKPEERRKIIEEAAGITKYKMRRIAAERKMQSTQQNLLRIQDITGEIEKRLNSLEKQAEKAEKHQRLQNEIKSLELHEACMRFFEFSNRISFLSDAHSTNQSALRKNLSEIESYELEIQNEKNKLEEQKSKLSLTYNLIQTTENTIALAKQDIQFAQSTLASKTKQAQHIDDESKRLNNRIFELNQERETLITRKQDLEGSNQTAQAKLEEASEEVQELTQTRVELHQKQNQLQAKILQAAREATQAQGDINAYKQRQEHAKQRTEKLDEETKAVQTQIEAQQHQKESLVKDIAQTKQAEQELSEELKALQESFTNIRSQIEENTSQQKELGGEFSSKQGRLSALKDTPTDSKQPEHPHLSHAAEQVEIPEAYESLFEDACKQRLEAYMVPNLDEGFELANQGRIRFFEQNTTPVRYEVVKSRAEALSKWPQARQDGVILITESGELFDIDHSCVAGERVATDGVLARKREINSLEEILPDLESRSQTLEQELVSLKDRRGEVESELDALRTRKQTVSLSLARLEEALKNKDSQEKNLHNRLESIKREQQQLESNPDQTDEKLEALQKKWSLALEEHDNLEKELAEHQAKITEFESSYSIRSEALTRIKIEAASSQERMDHLRRSIVQVEQNLKDIRAQIQSLEKQSAEIIEDETSLTNQEQQATQKITKAEQELQTLNENKKREQESCNNQKDFIAKLESAISEQRALITKLQESHGDLALRIRESELGLSSLESRIFEKYEVRPFEILHDYHLLDFDLENFEPTLAKLKRDIDRLGPINQGAIEEFAELKERYAFLSTQGADLSNALEQLESAIKKINENTKQRFEEAFNAVNERFSKVFPKLFRGGKAWLELVDPSDMLNTGIEIYAQPPGKKLGSIALMSGGEKALTAISLIFAIFLIKPSPFCLLDEVDAPLDEANVDRFAQMVLEMSKISQFIIITHNKRTMEKVDHLYGVTMEQAGISKTVNVKVKDIAPDIVGPGSQEAFVQ
ncbi:MAG: AAA family ATPase [Deltaproteobacteria bacterium]|nr:AAA family ATPase [Deltaproteobacteria bacterium]